LAHTAYLGTTPTFPLSVSGSINCLQGNGEVPNRFVWAAYFILPLTIVLAVTAAQGPRLGLELPVARALAVTGLVAGVIVARFYEDKAFLLWLPLIVFLLASTAPYVYAVAIGFLGGWTGLLPLAPLYAAIRQSKRKSLLFALSLFSSAASLLFAGSLVFTLVQNRLERESGSTFWFGFWRYLPSLDHSSFRTFVAIAACLVALVAFQRRWLSLPAAVGASMVISLSASSNFQHTRIWMVLPLVVFLLPSVRSQLWFLFGLLAWSLIPLIDFLGLGYVFAGVGISPAQELFLVIFTNGPVFLTYGLFVAAIIRGIRLAAPRGIGPCCPDSSMYAQVTKDPLS